MKPENSRRKKQKAINGKYVYVISHTDKPLMSTGDYPKIVCSNRVRRASNYVSCNIDIANKEFLGIDIYIILSIYVYIYFVSIELAGFHFWGQLDFGFFFLLPFLGAS